MRKTLSYALVVAAALGGCASPDPTTLALNLNNPSSLLVTGSTLFWISDPSRSDSAIQSIPIAGGKVTTVLAQADLDANLATDGTLLYFSFTPQNSGAAMSTVASCGLDGSNMTTLNSDLVTNDGVGGNDVTQMWVTGGTVYFNASYPTSAGMLNPGPFIFAVPATGGAATVAVPMGEDASTFTVVGLTSMDHVDSTGIYYDQLTSPAATTDATLQLCVTSLGGGSTVTLSNISFVTPTPALPTSAGLTVVNGTAFFLSENSDVTTLVSEPITGGTATTLATYQSQDSTYLVGDATGFFIDNEIQSSNPGIFSVTPSGTETQFVASQHALSTSVGSERIFALDSTNLYWVAGGHNGGQGTVHAKAR